MSQRSLRLFSCRKPDKTLSLLVAVVCATMFPFCLAAAGSKAEVGGVAKTRGGAMDALALDDSQDASSAKAPCDSAKKRSCEMLVQDNILWRIEDPDNPASKHWLQKNLDDLCACTSDPYATVNCFQMQVNNNKKSWQEGIAACRAKP